MNTQQSIATGFAGWGLILPRQVKGVFLIGPATEILRAASALFTPCTASHSLLEAVVEAAKNASLGDVVLLSPACSSFDQFRDYRECGEVFDKAVKSISGGALDAHPNMMFSLSRLDRRV